MSGRPREEPAEPSEFFIYGGNGGDGGNGGGGGSVPDASRTPPQHPPQPPPAATGPGGRRWVALVVAGVLILALGIAIGMHLGGGSGGAASPGGASSAAASGAAASGFAPGTATAAGASPAAAQSESGASGAPVSAGSVGSAAPSAAPFPTGPNACGDQIPLSPVSGARPPPGQPDLQLLAGADPRPVGVDAGTVGAPMFQLRQGQFVSDLAADAGGVVAVVRSCADLGSGTVQRVAHIGGPATVLTMPAGNSVMGLVPGGSRIWVLVQPPGGAIYDTTAARGRLALVSADGSGTVVSLPTGFLPRAGWHDLIIGTDQAAQAGGTLIQVYDLTRRGIVDQFGGQNPQFVVGDGSVIWAPQCSGTCQVHRFALATGTDAVGPYIGLLGGDFTTWLALSPDGARLAVLIPADSGDGPSDRVPAFRLAVADVESGAVSPVPGVELGMPFASVAFSPDSEYLAVAVATATGGRVLLYDRQLHGPYDVGGALPGIGQGFIPLVVAPKPSG